MTNFDKALNMLGAAASGILITGLSGGIAIPTWLLIVAAGVQFATGATATPMLNKKGGSIFTPKADARGQVSDSEVPK